MHFQIVLDYERKDFVQFYSFHRRLRYRLLYAIMNASIVLLLGVMIYLGIRLAVLRAWSGEILVRWLLVVALLAAWALLNRAKLTGAWKMQKEAGPVTLSFEEDLVRTESKNIREEIRYNVFIELYHEKNAYYLYTQKRRAMILPERCFTQGDPAAFGDFIAEKTGLEIKEIK